MRRCRKPRVGLHRYIMGCHSTYIPSALDVGATLLTWEDRSRKGAERAIEIAKRARLPLKMAAKVDPLDQQYFSSVIKPLLDDPLIEFIGEVDDDHKQEFLGNATALLFPIDWPEPFGLVMIEALSMGTSGGRMAYGIGA